MVDLDLLDGEREGPPDHMQEPEACLWGELGGNVSDL